MDIGWVGDGVEVSQLEHKVSMVTGQYFWEDYYVSGDFSTRCRSVEMTN